MISERLKSETRHLHDLTEAKFNSSKIFGGNFVVEDYRKLLLNNYFLLKNFEDAVFNKISAAAAEDLELEKRRKLPLILQDLDALGMSTPNLPMCVDIENAGDAWGIFYVMEGSTLGGNMIAKKLSKNELFKDFPFHYFRCYGSHTGSYWKTFKEILDIEISKNNEEDECIAGANKAYQFLLNLPD